MRISPNLCRTLLIKFLFGVSAILAVTNAEAGPSVTDFGPKDMQRDVRQVRMRFSDEMTALGDNRAADPAIVQCAGTEQRAKGRWIDGKNWVAEFENGLDDGISCTVKPVAMKTLQGEAVTIPPSWTFNTGGPRVLDFMSFRSQWYNATEESVTAFRASAPIDALSLKYLACRVNEKDIPVQILSGAKRNETLTALWRRNHGDSADWHEEKWIVAQCGAKPWPNDANVTWVWGKKIATPAGLANTADEPHRIRVRPPFSFNINCKQLAGSLGCDPRENLSLQFSENVKKSLGEKIVLHGSSGKTYTVDPIDQNQNENTSYHFTKPFVEGEELTPEWPVGFADIDGRLLHDTADISTPIPIARLPAYLGMAQSQGVMQWKPGQKVLWPLAARNTEASIPVRTWKFGNTPNVIPALLALYMHSADPVNRWDTALLDTPFAFSSAILRALPGRLPAMVQQAVAPTSPSMEFVGVPLSGYGTWLVEADSPAYRAALASQWSNRSENYLEYDAWASGRVALVQLTNLNINARISNSDTSLIWVTATDTGKPVANAAVEIWSCEGKQLIHANSDAQGRALINKLVVPPGCQHSNYYGEYPQYGLWIVAHIGQDISVLHVDGSRAHSRPTNFVSHTILDRVLFRAGETVSMQHLARLPSVNGWEIPVSLKGKLCIYRNRYDLVDEQDVLWQKDGSALSTWKIPVSAKLGQYRFETLDDKGTILGSGNFQVEEFRNPVFDAKLDGMTTWSGNQQTIAFAASLSFMAGGPAAGQTVVLKGHYGHGITSPIPGYDFMDQELAQYDGPDLPEPKLTLDKNGHLESSVQAPVTDKPITLNAEMQFADANGETQTQGTQVAVWPKRKKIGLRVGPSLQPMTAEISLVVLDEENHPVSNQTLSVDATEADQTYDGQNSKLSVNRDRFAVCTVQTDAEGKGRCVVPWNYKTIRQSMRQYWLFRAQSEGASTASSITYRDTFSWTRSKEVLERVSKTEPKAGEMDRLRIRAPFLPATVLLTIEREGVLSNHVHYLTKEEEEVDLPTQARFAPAVNVVARFVRGSKQVSATKESEAKLTDEASLNVIFDPLTHRLQVDVKPKQLVAHPGQTVQADIKVTRAINGKACAGARMTVIAFDDALTALKPNLTWSVMDSFWKLRGGNVYGADLLPALATLTPHDKRLGFRPVPEEWASRFGPVTPLLSVGKSPPVIKIGNMNAQGDTGAEQVVVTGMRASLQQSLSVKRRAAQNVEAIAPSPIVAARSTMPDQNPADSLQRLPGVQVPASINPRTDFSGLALWKTGIVLDANGEATVAIPLKDSLTRWRIVAVAMDGTDRYGHGSAVVQARQNIQILSGLPQTVRSDDVLRQKLTVRNTGDKSVHLRLNARAKSNLDPDIPHANDPVSDPVSQQALEARGLILNRTIELAAGENQMVEWPVAIPDGVTQLDWHIEAQTFNSDSLDGDALDFKQTVMPVAPVTVRDSTILQLDAPRSITVAQPDGARAGKGGVAVRWQASLVDAAISGARDWMRKYPYGCMEQRSSKAAVSGDPAQWEQVMASLPAHMDNGGLVRYFPTTRGSEILTAYLLDLSDAYQLPLPAEEKARMQGALQAALMRESSNDWLPDNDMVVYRLALQAAIAPNLGNAKPTIPADLNRLPTIALLDWVRYLLSTPDTAERKVRLDAAAGQLRNRYDMHGTRLVWREAHQYNLWWFMWSANVATARTALLVQQWLATDPRWKDDVPRLIQALTDSQHEGSWGTTTGNAWGVAAMQRFAKNIEQGPVAGISRATLGNSTNEQSWPKPEKVLLPWPQTNARGTLELSHTGSGAPWATVQITAAMKLDAPIAHGVSVRKTISAIEQRTKGQWSEGDVMKVTLEITSQSDLSWLAINDPIPSGATILGKSLGGESRLALDKAANNAQWWWRPNSVERANDGYRAYYERVWRGTWVTEYIVRLNNVGTFNFPATRVEAMYSPEIFGEAPNAILEVKP